MIPPNEFKIPATQAEFERLDEKSKYALVEQMFDRIKRDKIRMATLATTNARLMMAIGDKTKQGPQKSDDSQSK